ncbi:hypothetical protein [Cutibacterium avidum]|uniref:hypothetical protein n=1 Tax=Cutibacterium avidum TaxID=33010 RepID=UPI002FF1D85A
MNHQSTSKASDTSPIEQLAQWFTEHDITIFSVSDANLVILTEEDLVFLQIALDNDRNLFFWRIKTTGQWFAFPISGGIENAATVIVHSILNPSNPDLAAFRMTGPSS